MHSVGGTRREGVMTTAKFLTGLAMAVLLQGSVFTVQYRDLLYFRQPVTAILRDDPTNADAAFNYEYVVRLRAVFAARKLPVPPLDAKAAGLSIHRYEGAPPEESDMKKFKMIVPMRPDERLEAEKAGKGATKDRKG
jgi:hypothetical protein